MEEVEYKQMTYEEAIDKIKTCCIYNNGLSDPGDIACIECKAKSLCMKYSSPNNDTLKKKYIVKYSCECGYFSKLSDVICPLCGSVVKYIGTYRIKEE